MPALSNGFITFGSFNRHDKLNEAVIALWSQLLRNVPNAKLLVGATPVGNQTHLFEIFERNGVERSRVAFYPRTNTADYLALHNQVDICLDSFPYSGGTTTFHAAWMGVPTLTLTLTGETPPTRPGTTINSHLELPGFIAANIEDFVKKGCHWATHIDELAEVRFYLRLRLESSYMRQPDAFADSLNAGLRTMWRRWCAGLAVESFEVNQHDLSPD